MDGKAQDTTPAEPRLGDIVYEKIVARIVDGSLPVNERLPSEHQLAAMFGVSRPVLREALERLRQDGLIVSRRGSGSYVRRRPDALALHGVPAGSLADVRRFFEFRAGLEAAAAALAARNATPQDDIRIRAALVQLAAATRRGDLGIAEDMALHDAITDASGNRFHVEIRALYREKFAIGQSVTRELSRRRPPAWAQAVQDEHEAIVDAVAARDELGAAAAMRTHILNARNRMFRGVRE